MTPKIAALILLSFISFSAVAQLDNADPMRGEESAAACAACHGAKGNSNNGEWPNLAGQHADYIYEHLQYYKSGERENALMLGQAAGLDKQTMADLAVYFEGLEPEVGETPEELLATGRSIYMGGIAEKGVPACVSCHGPAGLGVPGSGYPRLSGQKVQYTTDQLGLYRSGERAGYGQAGVMNDIASNLTDEEIQAVANYVRGLYPKDIAAE
ncbi:Cytochrome c4 [Spiribacter salinus M19-40]|jgi:cytochrome c553|uniref:Cytochrome c4 n=1 Tax=Spiribacter salinus M19-40 TaxID=1260251 RepID=R4VQN8_9GAMM|nr:c-type cytochrome [Spiribacter salinus]AGM41748.1 Cytochrome c4 [Spiribacter salinus M19-40]MBY5268702.1 cytochrome C [Spiribacter salinus]